MYVYSLQTQRTLASRHTHHSTSGASSVTRFFVSTFFNMDPLASVSEALAKINTRLDSIESRLGGAGAGAGAGAAAPALPPK